MVIFLIKSYWETTGLYIPSIVTKIGDSFGGDRHSLSNIYFAGTEEQWNNIEFGRYNDNLQHTNIEYNYSS
jgi:hypothetical protein